jgi:hypothetical protein
MASRNWKGLTPVQLGPRGKVTLGQRLCQCGPTDLNHIFSLRVGTDSVPETPCFASLVLSNKR